MSEPVKLDVFCHVLPTEYRSKLLASDSPAAASLQRRIEPIRTLWDIDERLRVMAQFDQYQQVISLASPAPETLGNPSVVHDLVRLANDGMAGICEERRWAFPSFVASLPMNEPELAIAEARRAMADLGAAGIQIFTNVNGVPLDDARFQDFWTEVEQAGIAVWVHPARNASMPDYASETRSAHEIWWLFGWPYETATFMARMVFSGLMERHPRLKIITHHGGGGVPFLAGRVGGGMDQYGSRTTESEREELLGEPLPLRPIEYFHRFYADTAVFGAPSALSCALDFFGPERLLFASDSPFDPEGGAGYIRATIADVEALEVDDSIRRGIYEGNARQLLGIP